MGFSPVVVNIVGDNVSIVALIVLVFVRRDHAQSNVGQQSQLYLSNMFLAFVGIGAGLAAVNLFVQSTVSMLMVTFVYTVYGFTMMSTSDNRKLPFMFALVISQMIMQRGYSLYHFSGLSSAQASAKTSIYAKELVFAVTLPICVLMIGALVIFPWSAARTTRDLQCKLLRQVGESLRVLNSVCNPVSLENQEENIDFKEYLNHLEEEMNGGRRELRKTLYPTRCETRWRLNGEGRQWEELFMKFRKLPKQVFSLAISIGLAKAQCDSFDWDFIKEKHPIQEKIDFLVKSICDYCETLADHLEAKSGPGLSRLDKLKTIKRETDRLSQMVKIDISALRENATNQDTAAITHYVVMLRRLPGILNGIELTASDLLDETSRTQWSFVDWPTTLAFNMFGMFPSPLERQAATATFAKNAKKQSNFWVRAGDAFYGTVATDGFLVALKAGFSTVVFVLPGYFESSVAVFSSTSMLLGMRSLQSVLRQLYLGACLKRFKFRSLGGIFAYIYTVIAWNIAQGGVGTSGWSLALLALPGIFLFMWNKEKHFAKLYIGYSIVKNYIIIASQQYFSPGEQSIYVNGGWVTVWIVAGSLLGVVFCTLVLIVSAKRRIRMLLAECFQEYVHILEGAYHTNFIEPAYIFEHQPLISNSEDFMTFMFHVKIKPLLKVASEEVGVGEPLAWYKKVVNDSASIHHELWQLNNVCQWSQNSESLEEQKAGYEMLCRFVGPSLFMASAALQRNDSFTIFRPKGTCPEMKSIFFNRSNDWLDTPEGIEILNTHLLLKRAFINISASLEAVFEEIEQMVGLPQYRDPDSKKSS
uniref:Uncharacterized protein n=1 Tax=Mucochytrium quahogii TaxID=96639 RepID=A0A7S2SPE2_9STRA|mmetsp:Transcript_31120/g.49863  ORF Transcript_31120/g.49863 Transcript_31120/m.49863 type:complete len:814 (-) Transcript_31120:2461-4902(-)|eukprot:CAMPEP_0203763016 /NCGR_PEP_ID=MMETSP0098-20131031/15747_1 /ASSEMBLY_ACC=CAM_ASM_000208 /TAXON_ID=96639 /ORGANISM=" , Strain NY0313808BC1" /LENGTH=813 /DNA_ID=CAMNT_0050657619 /DNA_START=352 /DNA_END=2793 /DNA_ORIENTATION=+